MKAILDFISNWIWQLPQNLCGLVYKYISKNNRIDKVETEVTKSLGVEALIRWIDKEKGFIPPSDFIPLAEENDFIIELGDWIVEEALNQYLD